MHIPVITLVLFGLGVALLLLGQDPNKKHGGWALGIVVVALLSLAAGRVLPTTQRIADELAELTEEE